MEFTEYELTILKDALDTHRSALCDYLITKVRNSEEDLTLYGAISTLEYRIQEELNGRKNQSVEER